LAIDGVLVPLLVNEQFKEFDHAIQPPFRTAGQGTILRATLVGRFFAGKRMDFFKGKPWGGYGHMGCCTLLAIEEIESSDTENHTQLDYGSSPDQPDLEKGGCSFRYLISPDQSALLAWQQEADQGKHSWAIDDPRRVALETLSRAVRIDMSSMKKFELTREAQGRRVYICGPTSKGTSYMVVVSRPYWLYFYAHDASRVAWTAIAAYELSCVASARNSFK